MILVSHIEPLDSLSTYKMVSDLEGDYLLKFKKFYQPEEYLNAAIKRKRKGRKSAKKSNELNILIYLETNFDSLILKKPQDLHDTIIYFKKRGWHKYIYLNDKTTPFGIELLKIFGYTEHFRSQVNRGIWLAKQLNIKTCPYCNAQYTVLATDSKNNSIAKFQFDHFFSKDKYPYLSISLYNLIPCCANCNITKSKKVLNLKDHYHPYYLDFAQYFKFYLKYNPDPKKLTISQVKTQKFEIELVSKFKTSKTFVDEHNKLYHILGVFNRHQDIAEDLLMKAVIYTNHLQKAHLKIEGLFPDKSTYLRYLIGNYSNTKEILKRPLTKFIQDIAKQLKLI
jgi:hypothetical protein